MKSLFCLLACTAVALSAEPEKERNGLPLVFHESFADGPKGLARFEFTDPAAWKIDTDAGKNVLSQFQQSKYKPTVRSPINIAWVKDLQVGEFVLEVKLRNLKDTGNHRDLCLYFGGVDASHFFYVHLGKKADPNSHNIFLVDGSPRKNIATKVSEGTPWTEGYHTVRIERRSDGAIEVFWDGKSDMLAKSDKHPVGRVGVGSFDDTGHFAEITVWGKKP